MVRATRQGSGAVFLLVLFSVFASQVDVAAPLNAQEIAVPKRARTIIFEATNTYRAEHGVHPLRLSPAASKVARDYAKYLAEEDKLGHRADGRSARDRLQAQGIEVCHVWENWHKSWTPPRKQTIEEAMEKAMIFWKNSPGHARSMRSNSFEIGIGVVGWAHGRRWVYTEVQIFMDRKCLKNRPREKSPFPERVLP
jgi:uncharacterized protein YkwD